MKIRHLLKSMGNAIDLWNIFFMRINNFLYSYMVIKKPSTIQP